MFNDPAFHALNGVEGLLLRHEEDGRLIGTLGGALLADRFESGYSAPFGGFDVEREREAPGRVGGLVDGILEQLSARGVREVVIRCPPASHHGATESVIFALLDRGFTVADADLNSHVDLRPFSEPAEYVASLRRPARRALAHAAREPWTLVDAADDRAAWHRGYEILATNRTAKGRRLSLDRDYVERARLTFPDRIRMLLLHHAEIAVAAALSYRIREGVELVVAWGDSGHALERSPMNQLAYEVVARAMSEGTGIVDLGVSTVRSHAGRRLPDDGLFQFKQSVGATHQTRLVLAGTIAA